MPEKGTDDPREKSITKVLEEEPITEDSKSPLLLGNLKGTISLRTRKSFRTLNGFCTVKKSFDFLMMVYNKVGSENKFSYDNFGLGRSHFHATVTYKLKLKNFSRKCYCHN